MEVVRRGLIIWGQVCGGHPSSCRVDAGIWFSPAAVVAIVYQPSPVTWAEWPHAPEAFA
jgi:hypothetical protein